MKTSNTSKASRRVRARTDGVGPMKTSSAGFVLVCVLWVIALLTVVAVGFAHRASLERKMAWYALDHAKAIQMARGAVEHGMAELANKSAVDSLNEQGGYTGLDQRWARPVDLLKKGSFYQAASKEEFKDDVCEYQIIDCEGRISINHAPREMLAELDGMDFQLLRRIMSRREPPEANDQAQRFMTIGELRALEDIDDADWYGGNPGTGLRDLLTVWGVRGGAININTAPEIVLRSIPGVPKPVLGAIIGFRRGPDRKVGTQDDRSFHSLDDIAANINITEEDFGRLRRFVKTRSSFFTINAVATCRQGKIQARCSVTVRLRGNRQAVVVQWREDVIES